ncbi:MAG: chemotaxis-specific protein-glutamate methyltransferase CheB [Desulfovibrionaceae bacterium]
MRVGIINSDDSLRLALQQAVKTIGGLTVAWAARNGAEGLEFCRESPPDIVLADLAGPAPSGPQLVKSIMQDSPCAVLIATENPESQTGKIFEAMGFGALDAARIPTLGSYGELLGLTELREKIMTVSKLIGHVDKSPKAGRVGALDVKAAAALPKLLAIGSSTGGPKALGNVLSILPADLSMAVVVIQHVNKQFSSGLADWLSHQCAVPVRVAREGEPLSRGEVLLAGTDDHLIFGPDRLLRYTPEPEKYPYRPSVDIFFKSLAVHPFPPSAGVLLTGMGRDGAEGLLALRRAGWFTIAQDEATSTVYGMPKAAVELDAAVRILPDTEIGNALLRHFRARSGLPALLAEPNREK